MFGIGIAFGVFWGAVLFYTVRKNLAEGVRRPAVQALVDKKRVWPWLPAALICGGAGLLAGGTGYQVLAVSDYGDPGPGILTTIIGGMLTGIGAAIIGAE